MDDKEIIEKTIEESISTKRALSENQLDNILKISQIITKVLSKNGTLYLFGNGGSAADAQHIAAEFVGRFSREREPLSAEALTTNSSILTALGNDYDFSEIFSRQVKARVSPQDVVVGISTSGKSQNVLKGLKEAKSIGAKTIGFSGNYNNEMNEYAEVCLSVSSDSTPRIQETHILAWHVICELVEKTFSENEN